MNFKIHDNILKYQFFKILTLDFFFFPLKKVMQKARGKNNKFYLKCKLTAYVFKNQLCTAQGIPALTPCVLKDGCEQSTHFEQPSIPTQLTSIINSLHNHHLQFHPFTL